MQQMIAIYFQQILFPLFFHLLQACIYQYLYLNTKETLGNNISVVSSLCQKHRQALCFSTMSEFTE